MPWLCEGFPLGLLVGFSIWWKLSGKMGIWERGEGQRSSHGQMLAKDG